MSRDLISYQFNDESSGVEPYAPFDSFDGRDGLPPAPPAWQRYLSVLLRRKWLILAAAVIGTGLGVVASRYVQFTYRAETRLWIQADQSGPNEGPIRDAQLLESTGWLDLLKASAVLEHVVIEQRLFVTTPDPQHQELFNNLDVYDSFKGRGFTLKVSDDRREVILLGANETEVDRALLGDSLGLPEGIRWVPSASRLKAGASIPFYVSSPHDAARALGNRIIPALSPGKSFLTLSMQGKDPEQVARTLNAVADRFVALAAELKRSNLVQLTAILEEQLTYAERGLSEAEMALERFRVQTVTLPSEEASPVAAGLMMTRDPVFTNYNALRQQRDQLREYRETIERILREAQYSSSALDALSAIPVVPQTGALRQALNERVAKRNEMQSMELRYYPEYPPLQALVSEVDRIERVTIPALARELISSIASEEADAERRIASAEIELRQIPPRAIAETALQRDVDIAESLHTDLKQRYEVARLAAAGSIPDVKVLDYAVAPTYPTSDSRLMIIAIGLLGGLGLAVVGIVLVDQFDPRVRYPEQVTHGMGLPIIGMIPHLKGGSGALKAPMTPEAFEAFREIRLSLLHAHGAAGPVFFTVSSAEPGDGKSFTVANLALAFSQQGYRTLVIDGDIRRGRLHALLGGRRSPGLTDYLAGRVSHTDVVQATDHPNVFLIGSGTRVDRGPELLGTAAMGNLTKALRSKFDAIIVDSPPLGAGIDPYVLGTVSGNLLLVFRTGNTNRAFAQAKLALIDRLPIRVLGAVLNAVPASDRIYQYYGYLPAYAMAGAHEAQWTLPAGEDDTPPTG